MPEPATTTTLLPCPQGHVLPDGYTLHAGPPSIPEYRNLRLQSGLSAKTEAQAAAGINGAWFACHIKYTQALASPSGSGSERAEEVEMESETKAQAVAMGRVISDGGWYFHIIDMAVLPEHQRRGLGGIVLRTITERIPADAAINLIADPPGRPLYRRHGFVESAPAEVAMNMKK